MREHFVTRSGVPVRIVGDQDDPSPPSGSRRSALRAYIEGSPDYDRVIIELKDYDEIKEWLRTERQINLEADYPSILRIIVLYALEQLRNYDRDQHGNVLVKLEPIDVKSIFWPPRLQDRQLRVFLARRVHDDVSRRTLRDRVRIDGIDCAICGATFTDFVRAGQILEEEGYLEMGPTPSDAVMVRARAALIRDVERFSQLRYVQKFARDVIGHGEQLPDTVLRIACANAFALLPELAALSV